MLLYGVSPGSNTSVCWQLFWKNTLMQLMYSQQQTVSIGRRNAYVPAEHDNALRHIYFPHMVFLGASLEMALFEAEQKHNARIK